MEKTETDAEQKMCKRCNKHQTKDVICALCKNELLSSYGNNIDWQTAYEVEKAHRIILKYKMREDS